MISTQERAEQDLIGRFEYVRGEGQREGRLQGLREGQREGQRETALSNARKALSEGLTEELVQRITGLDLETICQLKTSLPGN
jgi:predicted transposase YdaD